MINRYHGIDVERHIIKFTICYILVVSAIMFIFSKNYALSFIIGGCVNIFCFKLTVRTVDRVIGSKGLNARSALVKNNISKMSIYLLTLVISGISATKYNHLAVHLEIIPTAFAFLSVKIMIYFKYFIYDKIFKVKNFDDSLPKKKVVNYKEKEGVDNGKDY